MFFQLPGGPAAAVLLALTPALLRWWWGRALAPLADDPVLAERLAAHHTRFATVAGACGAVLGIARPSWAIWSLPLLIVTQTAAGFPLRKILYQETWSLGAFLSFFGRLVLGVFGFWILLAATPWLASRAGRFDWIAAAALALILAIWNRYSSVILRALWRTQPIADPALTSRFAALVEKCGLAMPRFEYVAVPGGVFANAVALPALRGSSVIVSETLLSRLSQDETIAISAHELAHLEHFDRARLRRANAAAHVLIAAAAITPPLARMWFGSPGAGPFLWLWPCALVIALAIHASHRQKNETASDLRAVALTGDADALARALTTLHAIARVPRRWDQERERRSTHPSLARRIRDIRAAAGVATATLDASTSFRAATGAPLVTFEGTHLSWQETPGVTHVLDYAGLVELRLNAAATGAVTLVAVERQGRRWAMTPETADLPALQRVLDVVDGRLTHETRVRPLVPAVARSAAIVACAFALTIGQIAIGLVALLASISPVPALLNGAAAAALAAAGLMLRDGPPALSLSFAALFAALGAMLLGVSWTRRAEPARVVTPFLAILAAGSAIAVAAIGFGGLGVIRLHQGARAMPAALVLPAALAAVCWTWRSRPALRQAALISLFAAGGVAVLGSTLFLDRAVRDPFLVAAAPVTWTSLDGADSAEFDVPFGVETLRLSPHARLAALERAHEDDSDAKAASQFHVGRPGSALSVVDAADLTFVDDHRALLLVVQDGGAEVRDVNFDGAPAVAWRERIPDLQSGALTYEPRGSRWTILGRDAAGQLVRVAGTVGSAGTERTAWIAPAARGRWVDAAATDGTAALIVEKRFVFAWPRAVALYAIAPFLAQSSSESQVWRLRDGQRVDAGRSLLDTSCLDGAFDGGRLPCAAFDGTRTRIIAIDIGTGSVTALMAMDGHFRLHEPAMRGWLTGWLDSTPVALRLATGEAIRPPVPPGEYAHAMALTDAVVGTVSWKDDGSRIRLYPLR